MKNPLASGKKLHLAKNLYLRWRDGAGCCDTFSMHAYMSPKIARWLRAFRKQNERLPSHPMELTSIEEWRAALDEMIWAFEYETDWDISHEEQMKLEERAQKGYELFGKHFRSLWN